MYTTIKGDTSILATRTTLLFSIRPIDAITLREMYIVSNCMDWEKEKGHYLAKIIKQIQSVLRATLEAISLTTWANIIQLEDLFKFSLFSISFPIFEFDKRIFVSSASFTSTL